MSEPLQCMRCISHTADMPTPDRDRVICHGFVKRTTRLQLVPEEGVGAPNLALAAFLPKTSHYRVYRQAHALSVKLLGCLRCRNKSPKALVAKPNLRAPAKTKAPRIDLRTHAPCWQNQVANLTWFKPKDFACGLGISNHAPTAMLCDVGMF